MKNKNLKVIYQALFYLSFLYLCACVTPTYIETDYVVYPLSKVTKKDRNREIVVLIIDTIDLKKLKYLKKIRSYSCGNGNKRASVKAAIEMLSKLDSVPQLDIRYLDSIPSNIVKLKGLRDLAIINADMEELPEFIGQLDQLYLLMVGYSSAVGCGDHYSGKHRIKKLPDSFSKLKNLEYLALAGTDITTFPKVLCELKKLSYLDIRRTNIDSIPDCICNTKKTIDSYQDTLLSKLPCKTSMRN